MSKTSKTRKTSKTSKTTKASKTIKTIKTRKTSKTTKARKTTKASKTSKTSKTSRTTYTSKTSKTSMTSKTRTIFFLPGLLFDQMHFPSKSFGSPTRSRLQFVRFVGTSQSSKVTQPRRDRRTSIESKALSWKRLCS